MSLLNRIQENLDTRIVGDAGEAAAARTGNSDGFLGRVKNAAPKAVMVKPVNSTWEYNPVSVQADANHGRVGGRITGMAESRSPVKLDSIQKLDAVLEEIARLNG